MRFSCTGNNQDSHDSNSSHKDMGNGVAQIFFELGHL